MQGYVWKKKKDTWYLIQLHFAQYKTCLCCSTLEKSYEKKVYQDLHREKKTKFKRRKKKNNNNPSMKSNFGSIYQDIVCYAKKQVFN